MQFEPSWNLAVVLITGLAAIYVWYFLSESTLLDKPMGRARARFPLLIGCAWCLGFWVTGLILIATDSYDPTTHLAAAAVTGFVGSKA